MTSLLLPQIRSYPLFSVNLSSCHFHGYSIAEGDAPFSKRCLPALRYGFVVLVHFVVKGLIG